MKLNIKSNQIIELMEYQYTTRNELLKYQESEMDLLFLSTPTAGKLKATENESLDKLHEKSKSVLHLMI